MNPPETPCQPAADLPELCYALVEYAPVAMAELEGADHIVRYVNPAFGRLVGKHREILIGHPFAAIVQNGDPCLAALHRVYHTAKSEIHTNLEPVDPHPPYWSYAIWPVLDAEERPMRVMMQVIETPLHHQQIREMNQELLLSSIRQHELTQEAIQSRQAMEALT